MSKSIIQQQEEELASVVDYYQQLDALARAEDHLLQLHFRIVSLCEREVMVLAATQRSARMIHKTPGGGWLQNAFSQARWALPGSLRSLRIAESIARSTLQK